MLKIIYAGTPEFAVPALEALIQSPHEVVAVYTQPDRPAGRGRKLQPGPVKSCALHHAIAVEQPLSFKQQDDIDQLLSYQADLMVVAAYGLLLPKVILQAPGLGCVNIHASLLPRWRGAAPIQRAVLAGDDVTGITLMQMDEGLDTGMMLAKSECPIQLTSDAATLHDSLKGIGAELLMANLDNIASGSFTGEPQDDSQACYAKKLTKQEAAIDWGKPAELLHREIRSFNPWPVSYSTLQGQPVKFWKATYSNQPCSGTPGQVLNHHKKGIDICTSKGILTVSEIQFSGKKIQPAGQILNARNLTDECFGG